MLLREGLTRISEITKTCRSTLEILKQVADVIVQSWFFVECCSIRLLTPIGLLELKAVGGTTWAGREATISLDDTIAGQAVRKNEVVVVADIQKNPLYASQQASKHGFVSMMAVPITFGGDVIGVMQFYIGATSADGSAFKKAEKEWGAIVASMIAPVIARDVERRNWREMFSIANLTEGLSKEDRLERLLHLACQTLGACWSCYWSFDLDRGQARLAKGWDEMGEGTHGIGIERLIADTPTFQALLDDEDWLHIPSTQSDSRTRYMWSWAKKVNIVANIFFAVRWNGKIVGALVVDRNDCRSAFGDWDFETGLDLAKTAAVIMAK